MSSILKVDQIQLSNGTTPKTSDLGLTLDNNDFPSGTLIDIHTFESGTQLASPSNAAWNNTAHTGTVTPRSSSSKFFCMLTAGGLVNNCQYIGIRLLRQTGGVGSYTEIAKNWSYHNRNEAWNGVLNFAVSGYTSPATTDSVTFYTQIYASSGGGVYFNYGGQDATQSATLTIFEFAG